MGDLVAISMSSSAHGAQELTLYSEMGRSSLLPHRPHADPKRSWPLSLRFARASARSAYACENSGGAAEIGRGVSAEQKQMQRLDRTNHAPGALIALG